MRLSNQNADIKSWACGVAVPAILRVRAPHYKITAEKQLFQKKGFGVAIIVTVSKTKLVSIIASTTLNTALLFNADEFSSLRATPTNRSRFGETRACPI